MIIRDELERYLADFLNCERYTDYTSNGLQVEGRSELKRICTAVTASYDVILKAADYKADALFVHHGYFWRGEDPVITGIKRQRIEKLLTHQMNLFAYHLPLDCHLELGNNACIAKLLALEEVKSHRVGKIDNLLWSGRLNNPMDANSFALFLDNQFKHKPLVINARNKPIHSLAWCSGAAQDYIVDAKRLGVDAYISGEISERTYYQANELGIDYFSCGHHATERFGIQALGDHLAEVFDLEMMFIDSNNPC